MKLTISVNALKTTAAVALLALASTQPLAVVGQNSAQKPAAPATAHNVVVTEEQEEAAAPKKPGVEGVKVHGHWIIDVHNADGSIAEHRDFHNSLEADSGGNALLYLLTGAYTAGGLAVSAYTGGLTGVTKSSFTIAPAGNTLAANNCSGLFSFFPTCVYNLTTTVTPGTTTGCGFIGSCSTPGTLVLRGQFAPSSAFSFDSVSTWVFGCASDTSFSAPSPTTTAQCSALPNNNGGPIARSLKLTSTGISTVNVAANQYVVVSVTISFS